MKKLLKNTDFQFTIMVLVIMLVHTYFLFSVPISDDESHYATVAFRLINGDSLVQHEWHLTQFASLFTYLPVRIWLAIKGSADSMFIFLRCVYLTIHTSVAVLVYRFFKEYGKWAILASMIFYAQVSYGIQAISYQSMFAIFTLLLSLCIMWIYKKQSVQAYIFAGICFGCCCVCNPLFCIVFALYLVCCGLWTKKDALKEYLVRIKRSDTTKQEKKLSKKAKKEQKKKALEAFPEFENYNCFFSKEAILKISCGLLILAFIAMCFFFITGGTIDSIFDNIENLLQSSEYDVASGSAFSKPFRTIEYFSIANFNMPWILPVLFLVMVIDKNRKKTAHRFAYLAATILWMIVFVAGVLVNTEIYLCAISLPFFVFSIVCYILTTKKNKTLFFCMVVPCLIATFIHYLAADTLLASIGVVLAVTNVAGALFTKDLWKELRTPATEDSETEDTCKKAPLQYVILVAFCIQVLFYSSFYQFGQFYSFDSPKPTKGPYAGLHMTETQYERYNNLMNDLDVIKSISYSDDPVLLATFRNWMYLHLDRPFATYTTWYRGALDYELLANYYKANPEKIPRYIYLDTTGAGEGVIQFTMERLSEMFQYTSQKLSNGVLLTVHFYNL